MTDHEMRIRLAENSLGIWFDEWMADRIIDYAILH